MEGGCLGAIGAEHQRRGLAPRDKRSKSRRRYRYRSGLLDQRAVLAEREERKNVVSMRTKLNGIINGSKGRSGGLVESAGSKASGPSVSQESRSPGTLSSPEYTLVPDNLEGVSSSSRSEQSCSRRFPLRDVVGSAV
jgi:hypothetical protein